MNFTVSTKLKDIRREWHLFDVKDKVLGRIATDIAVKLTGKGKKYYVPNLDCGDYVVVINSSKVKVTGKKEKQKIYRTHSGYPGGMKEKMYWQVKAEHPERIIERAVSGMLPKNKLRDLYLKRLYVFPDENHDYKNKFENK